MKLREFFLKNYGPTDEILEAYKEASKNLKIANSTIKEMRTSFSDGGIISFEQMSEFEVSTAGRPVPYPTGNNCIVYLVYKSADELHFYCFFKPKPNEPAQYGTHAHNDCTEWTLQLEGTAMSRGEKKPPFSTTFFKPMEYHDYIMAQPGTIYVVFRKITAPDDSGE